MASGSQWQTQQRKKIKRAKVLETLTNHMVDPDTYPLKASQIKVAEMLLKRSLPELRSIEHQGKIDNRIEVVLSVEE